MKKPVSIQGSDTNIANTHAADEYDVIVIGGGPAGMMAAGTAASRGKRVLLLEKNPAPGKKLLITGGGRCNVTNAGTTLDTSGVFSLQTFLKKYKESGPFLYSPFSKFAVDKSIDFFESRGMPTKIENEGRVFPVSNTARSVYDVLIEYMKKGDVTIHTGAEVAGFESEGISDTDISLPKKSRSKVEKISGVKLKTGECLHAKSFILATGGTSRPETGSTGDGFKWLKKIGHTVIASNPSLVPIAIKDAWVKTLQGVALSDIKLSLQKGDATKLAKIKTAKGKILFTHFGITGPTVLNMSKDVGDLIQENDYDDVIISLDLLPHLDHGQLNMALQKLFADEPNKKIKNSLSGLVPSAIVPILMTKTDKTLSQALGPNDKNSIAEIKNNSITREMRIALIDTIKKLDMHVEGLLGADKAIVSSGGVGLNEIDFKTMASTIAPNLYIIGDVLNIDRPSGGYSLQLCWTTGYIAGSSACANAQDV